MSLPSIPPLPIGISDAELIVNRLDDWLFKSSWKQALESQNRAKRNPTTYQLLEQLYKPYPLLRVGGAVFPAVVFPASEDQCNKY
jgi:hypothetical protein